MANRMPCSTPTKMTIERSDQRDPKLAWTLVVDRTHSLDIDQLDADQEDNCREHGARHIAQGNGQEEQDHHDNQRRGEHGKLAAAAGAVHHLCLGGAAVDHECACQAGADIGQTQADQIDVLTEALAVACGVGTGSGCALRQDHDKE